MAEEGTLCINADVVKKAGASVNSASIAEAFTNVYIKMAEAQLSTAARYDFVTNYSSISDIGKEILRDAASSYAAILAINYQMNGYTSRQESLIMVNILWAGYQKVLNLLEKDQNYLAFIKDGTSNRAD